MEARICRNCRLWVMFNGPVEVNELTHDGYTKGECHLNPAVVGKASNDFCSHYENNSVMETLEK